MKNKKTTIVNFYSQQYFQKHHCIYDVAELKYFKKIICIQTIYII